MPVPAGGGPRAGRLPAPLLPSLRRMEGSGDTTARMRIPLERQRELYRRHADEAADRLVDVLRARLDELVELGFERAFDTVGVHEYGDSTYWKPTDALAEEAAAELADAIFYLHIPVARAAGDLPEPA